MSERKFAAIVLAAGLGTRMKSAVPKVLHALAGRPMIRYPLAALAALGVDRTVVVVGPGMDAVAEAVAPAETAVQAEQLGTGHAVLAAREAFEDFTGDVMILFGGDPNFRGYFLGTRRLFLNAVLLGPGVGTRRTVPW